MAFDRSLRHNREQHLQRVTARKKLAGKIGDLPRSAWHFFGGLSE
jgi:hypothetical protein